MSLAPVAALRDAALDAGLEAALDAQLVAEIAPYYDELECGFAATHLPRIGEARASIGFSTIAKHGLAITGSSGVVGKAVCTVKRDGALKLGPIAVLPTYRKRGYATAFLAAFVRHAAIAGATRVFATVPRANLAARRAFESAAFHRIGSLAGHYRAGSLEDVYAIELTPAAARQPVLLQPGGGAHEAMRRHVAERWFSVDDAWGRWLCHAMPRSLGDFQHKPHEMLHDPAFGTALVIYKRGRTAKVVPVADPAHGVSPDLVEAWERAGRDRDRPKIALFLPAGVIAPVDYRRELGSIDGGFTVWSRELH